jgi:hypothetical protein
VKQLTTALRNALGKLQGALGAAFKAGDDKLAASQVWNRLSNEQRATLVTSRQLAPPAKEAIGTEEEIVGALRTNTLADRRNLIDAVPQRFSRLNPLELPLWPRSIRSRLVLRGLWLALACGLANVSKGGMLQNIGGGIANAQKDAKQRPVRRIIANQAPQGFSIAEWCQRPVNGAHDFTQKNLVGRPPEAVTAARAANTIHHARILQLQQN